MGAESIKNMEKLPTLFIDGNPPQLLADALTKLQSRRHITPPPDFYTFQWPCFVQRAEKYELETSPKSNNEIHLFMNFHDFFNQLDIRMNKKGFFPMTAKPL